MCKRLEQVVNDVMLIGDAVEFLTDEKYFNAFEKYDIAFFFTLTFSSMSFMLNRGGYIILFVHSTNLILGIRKCTVTVLLVACWTFWGRMQGSFVFFTYFQHHARHVYPPIFALLHIYNIDAIFVCHWYFLFTA
jgi:hypothetical protein